MRLYTRQAFLALPPGTVFCKSKPWYFTGFMVKGETTSPTGMGDFAYRMLNTIERQGESNQYDTLTAMLEQGASVPLNTREQREGCSDATELFLVYEWADLEALYHIIWAALQHGDVPREEAG